ncbi:hypothetical protein ACVIDN_002558 [Rhizobium brockwellii]
MEFDANAGDAGDHGEHSWPSRVPSSPQRQPGRLGAVATNGPHPVIRRRSRALTTSSHNWVTNPGAHFMNSLCPPGTFPQLAGLNCDEHVMLKDACHKAFYKVKDYVERRRFSFRDLTQAEFGVLLTIERKTLSYSKLFEKLPRRFFWKGEIDRDDGSLRLNDNRIERLPPSVADESTLSKGMEGLLLKGWISKSTADEGPGGHSMVYSAAPIEVVLQFLAETISDGVPSELGDPFLHFIVEEISELIADAERYRQGARDAVERRVRRKRAENG